MFGEFDVVIVVVWLLMLLLCVCLFYAHPRFTIRSSSHIIIYHQSIITRSVNLVDFEHPFFSRVWHGVHILDSTSPLLTDKARQLIAANNGSWPSSWFEHPHVIQEKLDFEDLILTLAGVSNVSAVTVHAYKRYKIGDVLIGYNFAPLVFRDRKTGMLDVDLALANDVREQNGLPGEDLTERVNEKKKKKKIEGIVSTKDGFECGAGVGGRRGSMERQSTIRIKPGRSTDAMEYTDESLTVAMGSSESSNESR